ncbi:MAG: sodium:solute symporter family transporter, partial [Cyclobacteriaceae bacterium]
MKIGLFFIPEFSTINIRATLFFVWCCLVVQPVVGQQTSEKSYFNWEALSDLPIVGDQSEALGVAGPIAGVHNDVMIVAGGANFSRPYWESEKQWHDDIWVLTSEKQWIKGGKLDQPMAYSAVVSSSLGVVAMGGADHEKTYDDVLLLKWNAESKVIEKEQLPKLPKPCAYGSAALIGDVIYLAGGSEKLPLATAMVNFWSLDLSLYGTEDFAWEVLPAWPGSERAFNITIAQHNGYTNCIYVISGRREQSKGNWEVLSDVYEFNPEDHQSGAESPWRQRANIPEARMAGTGIGVGQSHLFILSGADGTLHKQADNLKDKHPGFPKSIFGYHTITNTWFKAAEMPANQVTTHAFRWNEDVIIASGEIKPRTRSPQIWKIETTKTATPLGGVDIGAIVIYLMILIGIGLFFSFRNKSTEDFFRGGQRVPWWAAGCSIFATMLSSLTFMSVPAKTYATDWLYFFINMAIIALAPFIIYYILPFFRRIDATSAYEYLELRFNLAARLFGSASYILFQIGRMAIVMYLPSLALAAVTPISIEMSILLMGFLSIIYCALGGIEAVIWTDTLQTFVLLGGALLSLGLVVLNPDIGAREFFTIATENDKFQFVDWDWSYTGTALWVVILGGLGQTLIPYSSDQGVIQRYMSVSSEKLAAKSIWTNAGLSFFATILFFAVGTALFVFYKKNPVALDPTFQTDAVFPLFIARQLPTGIAGIVIAGIFAAAQSTISTSMNSIATAFTTDFARRFDWVASEKGYLNLARMLTVIFGLLGTGFALLIAYADIKSLWDSFIGILGLFGGAMCGLFMLGIFTTRANGKGA